jgi:hypothetical protein
MRASPCHSHTPKSGKYLLRGWVSHIDASTSENQCAKIIANTNDTMMASTSAVPSPPPTRKETFFWTAMTSIHISLLESNPLSCSSRELSVLRTPLVSITFPVENACKQIVEGLCDVRNIYIAPRGIRMPAKTLDTIVARLIMSVRADLRNTRALRHQLGVSATACKAGGNPIARFVIKRLADQFVAAVAAATSAGRLCPSCLWGSN